MLLSVFNVVHILLQIINDVNILKNIVIKFYFKVLTGWTRKYGELKLCYY